MNDLRYALRGFMQTPAFTTAAVVALALGIGASTAVFSVIDAVLLSPLPYADAHRVVRVHNEWEGTPRASLSPAEFFDYLDGTADVFTHFGGWTGGTVNVTGGGEPERVPSAAVRLREDEAV